MRREGRAHGSIQTFAVLPAPLNPKPATRILNKLDSPPVAGIFTRVPAKPTNHSKFTGKCERARCSGCHIHPVGKSKDKSKGTQKIRSSDAALNYKLITWRVMSDRDNGLRKLPVASGYSASKMLDELDTDDQFDFDDRETYDAVADDDQMVPDVNYNHDDGFVVENCDDQHQQDVNGGNQDLTDENHDSDYENVSFYDVGVVWDPVEDEEGWSIVVAGR